MRGTSKPPKIYKTLDSVTVGVCPVHILSLLAGHGLTVSVVEGLRSKPWLEETITCHKLLSKQIYNVLIAILALQLLKSQ